MNGTLLLDPDTCRLRQRRLVERLVAHRLDGAIFVEPEHIEYFTGHRWDHRFSPVAAIDAVGSVLLVCPDKPVDRSAADDVRTYEAKWRSTLRSDQREASSAVLADWLAARPAWKRKPLKPGRARLPSWPSASRRGRWRRTARSCWG